MYIETDLDELHYSVDIASFNAEGCSPFCFKCGADMTTRTLQEHYFTNEIRFNHFTCNCCFSKKMVIVVANANRSKNKQDFYSIYFSGIKAHYRLPVGVLVPVTIKKILFKINDTFEYPKFLIAYQDKEYEASTDEIFPITYRIREAK